MLAIYDIANPKRLSKVAKIMQDYGVRVQKSKFELDLSPYLFKELKGRMRVVINHKEDGIKYIPLCQKCHPKIEIIGIGGFVTPDHKFIVL